MTLLFCEGFDTLGAADLATYGKWSEGSSGSGGWGNGSNTFSLVAGRVGGKALYAYANNNQPNSYANWQATADLGANWTTLFMGMGFMDLSTYSQPVQQWFTLWDTNRGDQIDLIVNSNHYLVVRRNGTGLCVAAIPTVVNTWTYLELGVKIDQYQGWVELRMDNVLQATYYGSGTSRATANGNTAGSSNLGARMLHFGASTSIGNSNGYIGCPEVKLDDLYVCNSFGTLNNDFLGDTQVVGLVPTGPGWYTQFSRGGSGNPATNWQATADNPVGATPDASYVATDVVGNTDTYRYAGLPTYSGTVRAVAMQPITRRDSAGQRMYRPFARLSSVSPPVEGAYGGNIAAASQYVQRQVIAEQRSDGTYWRQGDVAQMDFGVRVTV